MDTISNKEGVNHVVVPLTPIARSVINKTAYPVKKDTSFKKEHVSSATSLYYFAINACKMEKNA